MNLSVALTLAFRYMRLPKARSPLLHLITIIPLSQILILFGIERVVRAEAPILPGLAKLAGPALFASGGSLVLVTVFTFWFWWDRFFAHAMPRTVEQWLALLLRVVGCLFLTVLAGPIGFVPLIVYVVAHKPLSAVLRIGFPIAYVVHLVVQLLTLLVYAKNPWLLEVHANLARVLGVVFWALGVASLLAFVFVVVFRYLTIFAAISTFGMFIGCAAQVLILSVMSGFEADIQHKILGTHAHVVVTRPDDPFLDWQPRMPEIARVPEVVAVTPFLSGEAMISSSANRSNVVVKGIDAASNGNVTDLARNMEVGNLASLANPELIMPREDPEDEDLEPGEHPKKAVPPPRKSPPGIVLGRELAKSLRVYLGDDVSLISPTGGIGPSGAVPKARPYRVAGIFYSGMFEYDSKFVYLTLGSAQKLFDQPDEVTGLELKIGDSERTSEMVATLSGRLGKGYEVNDWKTLNRSLFSALVLEKILMFVLLSIIIGVAGFSILANGQMLVRRRMGEIAILKSMGANNATIGGIFFLVGGLLGLIGVLTGVGCGVGLAVALRHFGAALDPEVFYMTQLPVRLSGWEIFSIGRGGLICTILATVYPAWVAARMQAVDALREGR